MRSGIFGGTFDPVHTGHLIVAERIREDRRLDRILFMPSATPPHKLNGEITAAEHRLTMLRIALEDNEHFHCSDVEIRRGGVSYTVDTLAELAARDREDTFFLLVGADNIRDFHTWREPHRILSMATILVMTRPGYAPDIDDDFAGDRIELCEVPEIDISSTAIRNRMSRGLGCRYLLPRGVERYALEHGLYATAGVERR